MRDAEPVRRVVLSAFGKPEQLTLETVAEPRLIAPSELLVDVEASGINYLDVYQRSGMYQLPLPYTPGFEGVGRIRELGETASRVRSILRRPARVMDQCFGIIREPSGCAGRSSDHSARRLHNCTSADVPDLTAHYLVTEYREVQRVIACSFIRRLAELACCSCSG